MSLSLRRAERQHVRVAPVLFDSVECVDCDSAFFDDDNCGENSVFKGGSPGVHLS